MKKAIILLIFLLVAGAVFGQEDVFAHIDYFIKNFPQTNQEARDKLASWGYIMTDEMNSDYFIQYIMKDYMYQLLIWPRITSSNDIVFYFDFYLTESVAFYKLYSEAINYFTEKYKDFSKTIENNNHTFLKEDLYFLIGYTDTQHLSIGIHKRKNR